MLAPVDKMSTVLAALIAIVLFGETSSPAVKLVGTAVITLGTFLMIKKQQPASEDYEQDRKIRDKWHIPGPCTTFYNKGVTGLGPISIIQGDVFLVIVL